MAEVARNIMLTVQYDGTDYHGFQTQPGLKTVQETLEDALSRVTGHRVSVIAAGRTDSGVHATGQVVNFRTSSTIPDDRVAYAANSVLPRDIVVTSSRRVPWEFHARYSAVSKVYRYTVWNAEFPSPFLRNYALWVRARLDAGAMREAARHLVGTHDFASFQAAGSSVRNTVRSLSTLEVIAEDPRIEFVAEADGFLYHMVRIMVGTLLQVGMGKLLPGEIRHILDLRDRKSAGPTAPPHGLCLEFVRYQLDTCGAGC